MKNEDKIVFGFLATLIIVIFVLLYEVPSKSRCDRNDVSAYWRCMTKSFKPGDKSKDAIIFLEKDGFSVGEGYDSSQIYMTYRYSLLANMAGAGIVINIFQKEGIITGISSSNGDIIGDYPISISKKRK